MIIDSANMRVRFGELLDREIEEATSAAENEHIWSLGSPDAETASMHENNCEENRQYVDFLKTLKETYVG